MKKAKKFSPSFLFIFLFGFLIFFSLFALAGANQAYSLDLDEQEGFESGQIPDEFGSGGTPKDIREIVIDIVNIFLTFLAIIFLVLIIWGGYEWMMAGGNEDKVSKAKDRIKNGIIGMVIILVAYSITNFVIEELLDATTDSYDFW